MQMHYAETDKLDAYVYRVRYTYTGGRGREREAIYSSCMCISFGETNEWRASEKGKRISYIKDCLTGPTAPAIHSKMYAMRKNLSLCAVSAFTCWDYSIGFQNVTISHPWPKDNGNYTAQRTHYSTQGVQFNFHWPEGRGVIMTL